MDVETSKKLAKKLGSHIDEFDIAVKAIDFALTGVPQCVVSTATNLLGAEREMTAGEYLTLRNLWDLVK